MAFLHKLVLRSSSGIFFLLAFIAHPHWWSIIGFFLSCLFTLELGGVSADLISFIDMKNAIHVLFDPKKRNQFLEPVDLDSLKTWLPDEIQNAAFGTNYSPLAKQFLRKAYHLDKKFEKVCIYVRTFKAPPFDYLLKAYVNFTGTSFIFLRDYISNDVNIYQKFKFFHELAHVSMYGITSLTYRYERLFTAILGTIIVLLFATPQKYILIGLALFMLNEIHKWFFYPILFEEKADSFALKTLTEQEVKEVIRLFKLQNSDSKGFYRSYEAHRRIANMKLFYKFKFEKKNSRYSNISWNSSIDILWPVFAIFFGYYGYQFGAKELSSITIAITGFILLFLLHYIHSKLFYKVASKQAELEHWITYYSALSQIRQGLGFRTWDEYRNNKKDSTK